jgi:hypothetical protein
MTATAISEAELARLLATDAPLFPELAEARRDLAALRASPRVEELLARTAPLLESIATIPQTTYTRYQLFRRTGDREPYETPYYRKRANLHAATLHLFFGAVDLRDTVQDYLWSICDEQTWVVPAHARVIDLMAAETGIALAEVVALVGDQLDGEVRHRVRGEIDRRLFGPFLQGHYDLRWFNGGDNWNGVCAGALGATFLLLERDPERLARALALVLESLRTFLASAFAADGSSSEGVGYWHYGLTYVVVFAEMLRARTGGALDLLATPQVRRIAAFPATLLLSGGQLASFSDSPAVVPFSPAIIARLAERSGEASLLGLLAPPASLADDQGLTLALRDLLWWDGRRGERAPIGDAVLPAAGIARLTGRTQDGAPLALILKAGHNGENHNHNDIGSFILHVAGESLLTDPGPGRYDRDYFGARRYDNVFANSYGHSVPRVGGELQGTGREFTGEFLGVGQDEQAGRKEAAIELARAYPLPGLVSARRQLSLATTGLEAGTVWLRDQFRFAGDPLAIEEAFVTWLPVTTEGATALIHGREHTLLLTIERPERAAFALELLNEASRANGKAESLRRLSLTVPPGEAGEVVVRLEALAADDRGRSGTV